ncbi:hypothetical protein ACFWVP_20170 [Streptomyces sp. NPDC058637]|uniref:hypothetical protein n=1 Tax=Streptomyces sp. NPDC058637 TaxID=3346569 RepID=UPI00365B8122
MPGSRTGVPQPPMFIPSDDRIPSPVSEQVLRCRTEPDLFAIEDIHNTDEDPRAREKALAKAKHACSGCPIVKGCLKWRSDARGNLLQRLVVPSRVATVR